MEIKQQGREMLIKHLETASVMPDDANGLLEGLETAPIKQKTRLVELLKRPQVSLTALMSVHTGIEAILEGISPWEREVLEGSEIAIKYSGYIQREKLIAEKIKRLENLKLPDWINYSEIKGLTMEAREKLAKVKPESIGQASRMSGISPSDINVLLVMLGR